MGRWSGKNGKGGLKEVEMNYEEMMKMSGKIMEE